VKTTSEFAAHCLDLFAGLGRVEARSMFGGHAFFLGPAMFAIGDADEWKVWLKVDDETRTRFLDAGGVAFTYQARGRPMVTMSFVTPPEGAMEDGEEMLPWARLALAAAERAVASRAKPVRPPRRKRGEKPPGRRRRR
jgi:DNA transformation protein